MEPGYRKNTKFIISDRSSTGFINKNEALDLINSTYGKNYEWFRKFIKFN